MKCHLRFVLTVVVTSAVVFGGENKEPPEAVTSTIGHANIPQETIDQLQKGEDKVKDQKMGILKNAVKAKDRNIVFYGKVVDYDGQPVEDAIITIYLRYFDPLNAFLVGEKEYDVKTKRDGTFEFKKRGQYLAVQGIKKQGHEYSRCYSEYESFNYGTKQVINRETQIPFDPDSKEPFVFKVRKRGTVEYLVKRQIEKRFYINEEERPSGSGKSPYKIRVLEDWLDSDGLERGRSKDLNRNSELIYPETFEVQCQFNEDGSAFDLSFRHLGSDGGLIVTDEIGYLAPENGYLPQVHIQGPTFKERDTNGQPRELQLKKYLFVKDRLEDRSVYARIELEIMSHVRSDKVKNLYIKVNIFTNPAGGRSLEYDSEFNSKDDMRRMNIHDRRSKEYWKAMHERKEFDEQAFIREIREEEKQEKLKQK